MEIENLITNLMWYHDWKFTPGVYNHSIIGQAALLLESQQKRIAELEEQNRWIPRTKPLEVWKDENGEAINFLVAIPGAGVDIANWVEPTRC